MKYSHAMSAVFAMLTASLCSIAVAQDQPLTRAEVKQETRDAEKAGTLTPAGEGSPLTVNSAKSTMTRSQRKAATLLARKNNELIPAGGAASYKSDIALRAQRTTARREDIKTATRLAEKRRDLVPAGEGPGAPAK